jgi:hypothetical protein
MRILSANIFKFNCTRIETEKKARQRLTFSAFLKFVQINVYTITFPGDIILLLAMFQFSVTFAFKSLLSDVTQKVEC